MTRMQKNPSGPALRALPKGLTPAERALATTLLMEAPTPMWDLLDDAQMKALVRSLAARLKTPAAGKTVVENWTPPGEGLTHLLARMPEQPFLMDTIPMAAQRVGAEVMTVAALPHGKDAATVYMAVEALEPLAAQRLAKEVQASLALAQAVVGDFSAMASRLRGIIRWQEERAEKSGPNVGDEELERIGFLRWLLGNNFIFLGYRHYEFSGGAARHVKAAPGSGLGILRDHLDSSRVAKVTPLESITGSLPRYLADARAGGWLQISKTPDKSRVHRAAAMDYIGVLESDENGQVVGEHRFLGLYTSQAYTTGVRDIPLVRHKIAQVVADSGWPEKSDQRRTLINVLETFPRDELFLTPPEDLARMGGAMVRARKTASDVTVLARVSPREQAVTVFILAPIARYNSHVRERIRSFLHQHLGGTDSDFKVVEMGEGDLAHLLFKVRMPSLPRQVDEAALAEGVRAVVRGWGDNLQLALRQKLGAVGGQRLWQRFRDTFGAVAYQEDTSVDTALVDLIDVQTLLASPALLQVRVHPGLEALTLRMFSRTGRLALGQMMPVVGSFGLSAVGEQSYPLPTAEGKVWLHVLTCQPLAQAPDPATLMNLGDTVAACLTGQAEVDGLNALMLGASMSPLAVTVMRAFTAYLQQIDRRFDPGFVRRMLVANPVIAAKLWELFETLHNPHRSLRARKHEARVLTAALEQDIAALTSAEADRVARTLLQVVLAILRTNLWQDAMSGGAMAFKLDSGAIAALPEPKPWKEIFVYHPKVEGVHLRGGPVARGGLRHSDRATDYRTEVLGLMTAQMRKNTIIVPVGSKGGFYVKAPLPADRAQAQAAVRACYAMYVRALLSVTDTRMGDRIVPPKGVVCHDANDPYLVVAADKGTATYSDLANATALAADFWKPEKGAKAQGFWLGDAFASGGEHGYDHKHMGITARGAWVSVEHHMKALKMEAAPRRPIRVAGIGDMAGDVFGNGLLQSPHVQLVGAFNHRHIFLDPHPDPKASYAERARMFKAGLGWDGYDAKKLSRGGAVYLRSQKGLALSRETQQMLGLPRPSATPEEVIRALLKMPVDLLWNGGIGTFVKAHAESHLDAADRANDDLRVDAKDVHARIIGEGGNLGITPLGRVELARKGVRLNTDALDNSAGVSTSDHEVNLKILFQLAKEKGKLPDRERNALLPRLTEAVAAHVLADNGYQNMAVSMAEEAGPEYHLELFGWQSELLKHGILSPGVDVLPDEEHLNQRPHKKYVRPELCALLAGTKALLRRQLAGSDVLKTAAVQNLLADYFPAAARKDFAALIPQHPLAAEIISTGLVNLLANRCGMLMARRLEGDFACAPLDALRALVAAMQLVDAPGLWAALDQEAPKLSLATQVAVLNRVRATLASLAGWVLGQGQPVKVDALLEKLSASAHRLQAKLPTLMPEATHATWQARQTEWKQQGVSAALAARLAALSPGGLVPETVLVAAQHKKPAEEVLRLTLAVGEQLQLPKVTQHIRQMHLPDPWTRQAVQAMVREVFMRQCRLTEKILDHKSTVDTWMTACGESCKRYHLLVKDLVAQPELNVAMLSVLISRLRELEQVE